MDIQTINLKINLSFVSMKPCIYILPLFIFLSVIAKAQIYMGKSYEVSFFSDGPIEDIRAINKSAQVIMNTAKNEIAIKVTVKGFDFDKELMEEHFNEKYLESDKYPYAIFAGKIKDTIDCRKDGAYKVTVGGKLTIHGVEKERVIQGILTSKNGEILIESKFNVLLKDHNISIPSVVAQNVAETVEVSIKSTLIEYKK